jgi:hypothetical protein
LQARGVLPALPEEEKARGVVLPAMLLPCRKERRMPKILEVGARQSRQQRKRRATRLQKKMTTQLPSAR